MSEAFDLEAIYDAEIAPLMTKIIEVCQAHKMPVFATFLYRNDPITGGNGLCTTNLMFEKERPVPQCLLRLEPSLRDFGFKPFRLSVTNSDGSKEEHVIFPEH
jgi:hypothetical protein